MYNIILPLNFPHIYLHDLHLIKPQQTFHIPTRLVSHYHCSLIPWLLLHVKPSGLFIWGILLKVIWKKCVEVEGGLAGIFERVWVLVMYWLMTLSRIWLGKRFLRKINNNFLISSLKPSHVLLILYVLSTRVLIKPSL